MRGQSEGERRRNRTHRMPKLKLDTIHVVIADSDPLARRVVRDALQDRGGFVVPAEASSGNEAVELALHYRPDVALMETSLPGLDGLTATRRIQEEAPEVRVLILSRDDGEDVQLQALQAGAAGFISKNVPVNRFVSSLDPERPPADWAQVDPRVRWSRWNEIRTSLNALAFTANVAATALLS